MAEYIEREAALTAILNVPDGNWKSRRYAKEIKEIPAADVEPVRHGKWIETSKGFKCSLCKKYAGRHPRAFCAYLSKRCPNCGGKMGNGC